MSTARKARKTDKKVVRKISDDARLFEIGRRLAANEAQYLAGVLKSFGAKASTLLLPEDERLKRWTSTLNGRPRRVCIPLMEADMIAAILLSLPRSVRGPGKQWSSDIRRAAWGGLIDDRKINPLAREISEKTGQPLSSTRRRLQEMKASDAFKEVKEIVERGKSLAAASRKPRPRAK